MKGFRDRADVEDLLALIAQRIGPIGTECVDVLSAGGRRLAEPVAALTSVPGFPRAAMDGYAVRGEETFGAGDYNELQFTLVGESLPGRPAAAAVGPGQAVRIMTGAPMPPGADAVVMAEGAREEMGRVWVREPVPPGKNVGSVGEDITASQVVLSPPRTLRPQDLGVCAAAAVQQLVVYRRPVVSLIVTGDELLPAGSKPAGCKIVDANSVMLRTLVQRDGGVIRVPYDQPIPILPDDREVIRAALCQTGVDCLLVSGGSSVGREDHAPTLVAELGELVIHGLTLRPASPTGFGFVHGRPVFLLPGNPVSCLSAYDLFVGPTIRRQAGGEMIRPYPRRSFTLGRKIVSAVGRVDYVRVVLRPDGTIEPIATSGAAILSSTTRADGFVLVPKDLEGYGEGTKVTVYLYDRDRWYPSAFDRDAGADEAFNGSVTPR
jgi:molybdopterin molybdotransferase